MSVITGDNNPNTLTGTADDDRLDGRGGADTMTGGAGNDIYLVDNAGDKVVEAAGQGTDTVFASVGFTLGAGQSVDWLSTTSAAGTAALNFTGNELAQYLGGNAGANVLNGGAGTAADTLQGFGGNDTYIVNHAGDWVLEAAGQGTDAVFASVGYTLGAGQSVETLATTSVAGTTAINLTGNELAQAINGNTGANVLNGGGGTAADTLQGFGGNDTYIVNHAGDLVIEGTGLGTDAVFASVSYTLGAGQSVETLATTSVAGTTAINLIGNDLAQTVNGNAAANTIQGLGGDDVLTGQAGDDSLLGGAGNDVLAGGAGRDTLDGGAGNDIYRYAFVSESTGVNRDVLSFEDGHDKADLPVAVTAIDAGVFAGPLNAATFDQNLTAAFASAGGHDQLAAHHAALYAPTQGDLAGHVFIVVDANGHAGYQAGQDYVFELLSPNGTLSVDDFI